MVRDGAGVSRTSPFCLVVPDYIGRNIARSVHIVNADGVVLTNSKKLRGSGCIIGPTRRLRNRLFCRNNLATSIA